MKYVPPYGTTDPEAPYINGDPTIGQQGSIPPAAAFEHPLRELSGLISKAGLTPTDADLLQLTQGVRSQRLNYALDTNGGASPNAITVAYDPPITQYNPGLTLHVRIKYTNVAGQVSIDAGAGRVPIRKMNNSDVGAGELPVNSIATLIYDGAAFQLSNFGGAGGDTNVTQVNVPYTVDQSTTPGEIDATFDASMPLPLVAGNIIAVKCANTSLGPTVMYISDPGHTTPYNLLPNGGGFMLQGDIVAEDVVQFFYDGANLRFVPNPEINAGITYTVGAGQQFANVGEAMNALKRKTVGANGYVTLQLSAGIIDPIAVGHPSGDRIRIQGTLIGPAPVASDFQASGHTPPQRQNDGLYNLAMLRSKYGTEIRLPNAGGPGLNVYEVGIQNTGAGRLTFADLLVVGAQPPLGLNGEHWHDGVSVYGGFGAGLIQVTVWGAQTGFIIGGAAGANGCFACACTGSGWGISGNYQGYYGGAFGNAIYGYFLLGASFVIQEESIRANGDMGLVSGDSSGASAWFCDVLGNANFDLYASNGASLTMYLPSNFGPTAPPINTVGNLGGIITTSQAYRPPPPNLP